MGFILFVIFMLFAAVFLPPYLTFRNFENLFVKKHLTAHLLLTVIVGGILYCTLYEFIADGYVIMNIRGSGIDEMFNSDYKGAVQACALTGLAGLLFIGIFSDYPAPFMSIAAMGAVIMGTVFNIFVAVHEFKVLFSYSYAAFAVVFFYAYQLNLLVLAYIHIKRCLRRQSLMINISISHGNKGKVYKFLAKPVNFFVSACVAALLVFAVIETVFSLGYRKPFPLYKAFTQTSGWTFSALEPVPPPDYYGENDIIVY